MLIQRKRLPHIQTADTLIQRGINHLGGEAALA